MMLYVSACGILAMFLLRPTPWVERAEDVSFLGTMRGCWRLFCSPNMLVLCVTLLFTGLNQSLWAGIYSGCIGFTKGYAVDINLLKILIYLFPGLGRTESPWPR